MTGKFLGAANVAAVVGSTCLAGNRAVLVGEHEVTVVEAPRLRRIWRSAVRRPSGKAAVCGNRVAFAREDGSAVEFIDLPPAPGN